MMSNNMLFWLLMCGHVIGDFYVQPQSLVNKKMKKVCFLLLHSVVYILSILIFVSPVIDWKILIASVFIFISHFTIDFIKIKLIGRQGKCSFFSRNAFCIDQAVHIAILLLIACLYANYNTIELNSFGHKLLSIYKLLQINIEPELLVKYLFIFLLIGKPSNILIKEVNKKENIRKFCDDEIIMKEGSSVEYQNAGKMIGILERYIVAIMIALKQYAAIGLIFTAKSITRYDKIAKDPAFAEYYLVGTLLSLLIPIVSVLIVQVT